MLNNALSIGLLLILKLLSFTGNDKSSSFGPTDFEVSTTATCIDGEVTVTYTGDAPATASFNWDFDGATINSGGSTTGLGPFNISWPVADEATKTIILTVTVDGNSSTNIKTVSLSPTITNQISESICEGDFFLFGTDKLTEADTYVKTFTSPTTGCDSMVTLTLTVNPVHNVQIDANICQGDFFLLGTDRLTVTDTYVKTFQSVHGCDSMVTVNLTVFPTFNMEITEEICQGESYLFGTSQLTTSDTYTEVFQTASDCDSTVVLNLIVHPNSFQTIDTTICEGESFLLGEETLTETNVYTRVLLDQNGCDSTVTVNLTVAPVYNRTVNAAICEGETYVLGTESFDQTGNYEKSFLTQEGCDSTIMLNLTVFPSYDLEVNETICEGETFMFDNEGFSREGTYPKTFQSVDGCDSIVTLNLTVLPVSFGQDSVTICEGDLYLFEGDSLRTSGSYSKTFTGANGCDSTFTVELTVIGLDTLRLADSFCEGDIYRFGNQSIDQPGEYAMTFASSNGCDSTVVLDLTMNPSYSESFEVNLCEGETYEFADTTLTEEGLYTQTFQTAEGCDSIVTISLFINPRKAKFVTENICDEESYFFIDETLTEPGIYTKTIPSAVGCDSTVILTLIMGSNVEEPLAVSLCQGSTYTFGDEELSTSGTYVQNLKTVTGCDSTVVLNLFIESEIRITMEESICEGESYIFGTDTLATAGTYQKTFQSTAGCDSIVTLSLSLFTTKTTLLSETICNGEVYLFGTEVLSESGEYESVFTSAEGCDSTVTLSLTILEPMFRNKTEDICEGSSYVFDGEELTEAGLYQKSFVSTMGCDSVVTIKIVVTPIAQSITEVDICTGETYRFSGEIFGSTGTFSRMFSTDGICDSLATLILTVSDEIEVAIDTTVCTSAGFQLGTETIRDPGTYTRRFTSSGGCDSTVTLKLQVVDAFDIRLQETICEGETYLFGDSTLTRSGIYVQSFPSTQGCDSTVTIDLRVLGPVRNRVDLTMCEGDFTLFGDRNLTEAGTYIATFESSQGCDSVVTLNITLVPRQINTTEMTICEGEELLFGDSLLTTSGTYLNTFVRENGCDSVVSLQLEVKEKLITILEATICKGETYLFGNDTLTEANVYTRSFPAVTGCDSTVNLLLMVEGVEPARTVSDFSVCQPEAELTANLPEGTTGSWSVNSTGTTLTNDASPETLAMELSKGQNTFSWTLSTENCPDYSTDELAVTYAADFPIAENDFFGLITNQTEFNGNVVTNDQTAQLGMQGFSAELLDLPTAGSVSLFRDGSFNYFTDGAQNIDVTFNYLLINEMCPEFRDTAVVTLVLDSDTKTFDEVIGVTPNGDGVNDYFILPELRIFSQRYEDNELFIFNRWGDQVLHAKPYNNDWDGRGPSGIILPAGTYYYMAIFRTDTEDIKKDGMVVIVR